MNPSFDSIIVITPNDFKRVRLTLPRVFDLLPSEKIVFISSNEVKELISCEPWASKADFVNEEDILPFKAVSDAMCRILNVESIPRGVVGWYYQQFLKMKYSEYSSHEYYMSWDGDTIPTKPFSMFCSDNITPYFDMKYEVHEEYFTTAKTLLGIGKVVKKSFISEHMLFKKEFMKELIAAIESKENINGSSFFEKILTSIRPSELLSNSFSEFETYGSFIACTHPSSYKMRDWHSIRYGSIYFKPEAITEEDYNWLGNDFDAISFEKNQEYNPDIAAIFNNVEYRKKLTARQIIEAIQDSSEGMREEWEDSVPMVQNDVQFDEAPDTSSADEYLFYNYLGDNLLAKNPDQAFLCYENAEFLCDDANVKAVLCAKKDELKSSGKLIVRPVSIVIVSFNSMYLMQNCITSIKKYCAPHSYSIIVVDNASSDGIAEWLNERQDIKLISNSQNVGFPQGCNIGIKNATLENDIFLLNNDTRMTHNALFWLRMGLYDNEYVGATGCVSNYCNVDQSVDIRFSLPNDFVEYGRKNNVYMKNPYEEKAKLSGFALLLKRQALNQVGMLNEAFSPGYFEDDELCIRIRKKGFQLLCCHNSFIYHAGSQSFAKRQDLETIFERNHMHLRQELGYDTVTDASLSKDQLSIISQIEKNSTHDNLNILEINSGCGCLLGHLKYLHPTYNVIGIESNRKKYNDHLSSVPMIWSDNNFSSLPFPENYFDYIIFNVPKNKSVFSDKCVKEDLETYIKDCDNIFVIER